MRIVVLLAAICAASVYLVGFQLGEGHPGRLAFDVYGYFYPHMLYALRSLHAGGQGLLWNPFQNCGQPFLGITETGLLYPLNVLFLVLEPPLALRAVLFTNLVIGGLGAYGLLRQLGAGVAASIGAALAFVLAAPTFHLTTWMPTVQAPYVWMPVAMLCCERLVRSPSLPGALWLGIALAAALLPGHPQFVLFTCQLVALRLVWSLFDGAERRHLGRAFGYVALAMLVMLLLTAAQYVASLEVIGESIRSAALTADEIAPRGLGSLAEIAEAILRHTSLAPFNVIPGFLAAVALVEPTHRRAALFYGFAAFLFLLLSFGDASPLGRFYYGLPISGLFREPLRFRFVTGFCMSVLAGLAIDVLVRGSWRGLVMAAAGLGALVLWLGFIRQDDWYTAAVILAAGVPAALWPAARKVSAAVIVGAVATPAILHPNWTTQRFLADDQPYYAHAAVFERLQKRLTPQERVHIAVPSEPNARLVDKTAMLFELRGISDYDLQLSRRYAEYLTMLRRGEIMETINQVNFPGLWNPRAVLWPLVNLAAVRYLIVDKSFEQELDPDDRLPLTFVDGDDRMSVYENGQPLPRAYYVPQIAVEPNSTIRLQRLARGVGDRRTQALVTRAPESGFLGVPGNVATADAQFVVDDPERVVIETVAPERGFVFLADQYYPGWSATVNGQPTPILIANHAFRAVEVPAGPVTVDFVYRPPGFWIGAAVSIVTAVLVAAVLVGAWLRQRGPSPNPAVRVAEPVA